MDGKNARLSFTAGTDGPYYVAINNEQGIGEYELLIQSGTSTAGDFDADGDLDCDDVNALTQAIASGSGDLRYDVTGDNLVNLDDLDEWVLNLKGTLFGDADLDFSVDGNDFILWNASKFTSGTAWCSGDFNADGRTDGEDFLVWNANKFTSAGLREGGSFTTLGAVELDLAVAVGRTQDAAIVSLEEVATPGTAAATPLAAQQAPRGKPFIVGRRLPATHVESIFAQVDDHWDREA